MVALAGRASEAVALALLVGGIWAPASSGAQGSPAGGAQPGAYSQLVWTKPVGRDTTRFEFRYEPLFAAPGHNLILVGPVTIEKPPGDGWVTRVRPDLVDASGKAPPIEQVHMHHAVMLNLSRKDTTYPSVPQRFYGFGEEKTIGQLPRPYGYPVSSSDVWAINYMLHNETSQTKEVWVQYDIDWIPASSPTGDAYTLQVSTSQADFANAASTNAVHPCAFSSSPVSSKSFVFSQPMTGPPPLVHNVRFASSANIK